MVQHHVSCGSVRLLLVVPVIVLGIAGIVGSGNECTSAGGECSEASDCCSSNCQEGACCIGVGDLVEGGDSEADCCSEQSVMFGDHRYCCATDGMAADSADYCCSGLSYVDGVCWACPPGCSWTSTPSVVGEDSVCVCPDENGGDVTVLECPACVPCPTANPDDLYLVRVYSVEKRQCTVVEVWSPDPTTIEDCAKQILGLSESEDLGLYVIENVTEMPAAQTCAGLW